MKGLVFHPISLRSLFTWARIFRPGQKERVGMDDPDQEVPPQAKQRTRAARKRIEELARPNSARKQQLGRNGLIPTSATCVTDLASPSSPSTPPRPFS